MPSNAYDAVVVGGRVAGASTAMLLARAGARVALVERSAYGTDVLSTHGLMRAGVLQLTRWGLLDRVVAAGTPPIRVTSFHHGTDEPVHISIRPSGGVEALYAPRRQVLDRILVDAAAEAGADVRHGTRVTDVICAGDRVPNLLPDSQYNAANILPDGAIVGRDRTATPFTFQPRLVLDDLSDHRDLA